MKRKRIELSDITCLDNLHLAAWKAARGKRHRPDVMRFMSRLDENLARLTQDVMAEKAPYGDYQAFRIHDPKERLIHAACFADRVLHHAMMNLAEPVFERTLTPTTYACRPGKGVHAAIRQVQANLRRFPWLVDERKLEIKGDAIIKPSQQGVAYCGYKVLRGAVLLNQRKRRRYQQLRLQWEQAWVDGEITELELQQAYQSVHAITLHADSDAWRRENLRRFPPPAI